MSANNSTLDSIPSTATSLENRLRPTACNHLRTWLRYLSCGRLIENEIRSRLRREFQTTLPRYEVMAQLEQFPQGIKMSELSKHLMVTNGNITGIAHQLIKEGLIQRTTQSDDRRSSLLSLTDKGRAQLTTISDAHNEWVCSVFGQLSNEHIDQMMAGLEQLKKHSQQFSSVAH